MLKNPMQNSLEPIYMGPYIIKSSNPPVYTIESYEYPKQQINVHHNRLKEFTGDPDLFKNTIDSKINSCGDLESSEDDEYNYQLKDDP